MYFKCTTTNVFESWHCLSTHTPTSVLYLEGWCLGESPEPVPQKFHFFLVWIYWMFYFVQIQVILFWISSIYPISKQVLASVLENSSLAGILDRSWKWWWQEGIWSHSLKFEVANQLDKEERMVRSLRGRRRGEGKSPRGWKDSQLWS